MAPYLGPDVESWRTMTGAHNPWAFAIQPLIDHGCLLTVDAPHEVTPSDELFATPGHTPGHISVRITSGAARAVITGDMVHSPVRLVEPDWTYRYDSDAAQAARSVRLLLDEVRDTDAIVLGTHFPSRTGGRIRTLGDGLGFVEI